MKFSLFIAFRYLFAKKSHNAINIISLITIVAVAMGTASLIVILSVFNGFDQLIRSMIDSFDPDIKITAIESKVFAPDSIPMAKIENIDGVLHIAETLEENALLRYEDKQSPASVKGVSDNYIKVTGVDSMLVYGEFILKDEKYNYSVIGAGISIFLDIPDKTEKQMVIYMPKRSKKISVDPLKSFNRKPIFISGKFSIEQSKDSKYIFVPLSFARELLSYNNEISAIEIKVDTRKDLKRIQQEIQKLVGDAFVVKNRYQQNEMFYKVMKMEKWAIALILSFVLFIASFNLLGSLTMLILDKKKDIAILRSMGASNKQIRNIFYAEGWMITLIGGLAGLFFGSLLCFVQIYFEPLKLYGSGSFVISAYPVHMNISDFLMIFIIVLIIGFFASWYPVRKITRKYLAL